MRNHVPWRSDALIKLLPPLRDVNDARNAIDNCDKMKYDRYDTKALSALSNLDESSPQSILIKVTGDQVAPAEL